MAGEARLEGEVAIQARYWLRKVTDILDSRDIKYFLDAGTLLGIVRENRLLPWDNDLDIFIPSSEFYKLKKCCLWFFMRGLRVRVEKIGIDAFCLTKDSPRIIKLRNRSGLLHRGQVSMDIFIKYPVSGYYYWAEGRPSETVIKCVSSSFFDSVHFIDFDGKKYPVPGDYEGYLESRYGDWRTPVKDWDHRVDDSALI